MRALLAIAVFLSVLAVAWPAHPAPQYCFVVELQQNPCSPTWLFAAYPTMLRCEEDLDMIAQTYPGYRIMIHTVEVRP